MINEKHNIRKRYSIIRKMLTESERLAAQKQISLEFFKFIKRFSNLRKIGVYLPMSNEINLLNLIYQLNEMCFTCLVPKMISKHEMIFTEWLGEEKGQVNIVNVRKRSGFIPSLMIVPALSCDVHGNRLGYGKGVYDRFLQKHSEIIKIALLFEDQIYDGVLPNENHDVKIDYLITEKKLRSFSEDPSN